MRLRVSLAAIYSGQISKVSSLPSLDSCVLFAQVYRLPFIVLKSSLADPYSIINCFCGNRLGRLSVCWDSKFTRKKSLSLQMITMHCQQCNDTHAMIFCFSVRKPDNALSPLAIHFEYAQISVFCYIINKINFARS